MVSYVANTVEQALLLPEDMAKLRSIRRHEVFFSLKRYLVVVCPLLSSFFSSLFLYCLPFFLFLIYVAFLGKLFKPPFGWRRQQIIAIDR